MKEFGGSFYMQKMSNGFGKETIFKVKTKIIRFTDMDE